MALVLPLPFFFFFREPDLPEKTEKGTFSVYFLQEQVGYEEYSWVQDETGYSLIVRGRMTKPVAIEIDRLEIHLDESFIAERYLFRGKVSGVEREISSVLSGGKAVNTVRVGGVEQTESVEIRRDVVLLPNPVYSPYMGLTKKFRCGLAERVELSAYIIPQMEVPVVLEPVEGAPCRLRMDLGHTQFELQTDEEGTLLEMSSPSLRVVQTLVGVPIR